MTEIDRIAEEVNTSGRTLRRAVGVGLVRGRRIGPKRFLLGAGEGAYLAGHWELIGKLRQALRTEPSVEAAVLFGSTARGDDRPRSDVDLFVQFRKGWTLDRLYGLEDRLAQRLDRPVDVVVFDEGTTPALFLVQLLEEGRPVVDRVGFWPKLQGRQASIERAARHYEHRREAALGI